MNTTGFIRGYMAKNLSTEKFIEVVRKALSTEFETEVELKAFDNKFKMTMEDYSVTMSREFLEENQGPYSIDKYILNEYRKQGFNFDINRSQYIQYCHGIYNSAKQDTDEGIKVINMIRNNELCDHCGNNTYYCVEHDADHCSFCDKWLENACKDPQCEFCKDRPDKPSDLF